MRISLLSSFVVVLGCSVALGQVPADLAAPKNFTAHRASSADPSGKNADARPVARGRRSRWRMCVGTDALRTCG
ncbi:MAG: hypothetical protein QM783_10775 [Phycisphaerales bacterium]